MSGRISMGYIVVESAWGPAGAGQRTDIGRKIPAVDAYESETGYTIEVEAAGYERDDISITIKGSVLRIATAEGYEDKKLRRVDGKPVMSEIRKPSFSRSFRLPEDADTAGIEAESRNGMLIISIPRNKKKEPGRIEITRRI